VPKKEKPQYIVLITELIILYIVVFGFGGDGGI
jgi:hypothetical protein